MLFPITFHRPEGMNPTDKDYTVHTLSIRMVNDVPHSLVKEVHTPTGEPLQNPEYIMIRNKYKLIWHEPSPIQIGSVEVQNGTRTKYFLCTEKDFIDLRNYLATFESKIGKEVK